MPPRTANDISTEIQGNISQQANDRKGSGFSHSEGRQVVILVTGGSDRTIFGTTGHQDQVDGHLWGFCGEGGGDATVIETISIHWNPAYQGIGWRGAFLPLNYDPLHPAMRA